VEDWGRGYWRSGIQGLLGGRCGRGRPGRLLVGGCYSWGGLKGYLCVYVYDDIIASIRHGWATKLREVMRMW